MSENSGDDAEGELIPVSCGNIVGRLHHNKFMCPGIHQKCLETEEGEMVTPKAFCILGEKEKLKDWKNAIRVDGKSIRKRMDRGELDFYRHEDVCSGRCASRNGGPSKYDIKIESLKAANEASWDLPPTLVPLVNNLSDPAYTILRQVQGESSDPCSSPSEPDLSPAPDCAPRLSLSAHSKGGLGQVVFPSPVPVSANHAQQEPDDDNMLPQNLVIKAEPHWGVVEQNSHPAAHGNGNTDGVAKAMRKIHRRKPSNPSYRRVNSSGQGSVTGVAAPYLVNGKERTSQEPPQTNVLEVVKMVSEFPNTENLLEDSISFWQGIKELGLLDEFVRDIKHSVDCIKMDMVKEGIRHDDATKLSTVVSDLGLVTKLKWRIAEHKSKTEHEKEILNMEIEALKRKVAESEQKQQMLKRKSECFDQLMEINRPKQYCSDTANSMTSALSSEDGK